MSDRVAMLAYAIGIPANVLRAIARVESGARANAVRFEPHLFHRLTDNRYTGLVPWTPARGSVSLTPSETNRAAFERAYRLDPVAAVKATSWGRYQVLGRAGLALYGSPQAFVRAFDADPDRVSDELLAAWFRARPDVIRAVLQGDWATLARRYNGSERWQRRFEAALEELDGVGSWWVWPLGLAALAGAAYLGVRAVKEWT